MDENHIVVGSKQTQTRVLGGVAVTGEQDDAEWVLDFEYLTLWRERMRAVVKKLKQSKLSSRMDTSDLVQEGMLQMFKQLESFRGTTEQEFEAWIQHVAAGSAANANRFHHAGKRDIKSEVASLNDPVSDEITPNEAAEQKELLERIASRIEQLEPRERTVLLQYTFENRTFEQIAESVGCSPATVSRVHDKALRHLGRLVESDSPPPSVEPEP